VGTTIADKPATKSNNTADSDDMDLDDFNLNDSLEDTLKETNVTELKLANRRLERQVKQLQEEQAAGRSQKAVVLQHLLDDANRLKTQFEKSYIEVSQERDILQSDMARIREGIPDALVDQSSLTLSLRLHTVELEKEIKALRETVTKLEKRIEEGRFNDPEATGDMRNRCQEIEQKFKHLEEQNKKQLEDINKLLIEKDILQGRTIEQNDELREQQRLNGEMKASLAAYAAQNDDPIRQQNAHMQQQTIQLQEQLHEIQLKLKKAKEV
jgi:protein HOOK3